MSFRKCKKKNFRFQTVVSPLNRFNFIESTADKCIYMGVINEKCVYLALFVDDGLIANESNEAVSVILDSLKKTFDIRISNVNVYVGMQIKRDRVRKSMFIYQSLYTKQIIFKFGMGDAESVSVPSDPYSTLSTVESENQILEKVPYREAVEVLRFLSLVSRPGIVFAVNQVSRYCNKHNQSHWLAVKRIFKYLIGTMDYGLLYESGGRQLDLSLRGYSDADFAGDVDTRRSTNGYVFLINKSLVTLSSQRQKLVTLRTTESEYVAAAETSKETVWLRQLLNDLKYKPHSSTVINVDNQSVIRLLYNPVFHKRTKHIDIKYHFIRERVETDQITIKYVPTSEQLADLFTKALAKNQFNKLRLDLSICDEKHENGGSVGKDCSRASIACVCVSRRERPRRQAAHVHPREVACSEWEWARPPSV